MSRLRRRNLRLPSSSDEDDEPPRPQTLAAPSPPSPTPNPEPPSPPLEISDDDFVDVPDDLSDPSPPPSGSRSDGLDESIRPIYDFLQSLGLRLRPEWLASCVAGLERSRPGFGGIDVAGKAKFCFGEFLLSDMNSSGAGILPENVSGMHKVELKGPFVLQVDEVINICSPLRERYHEGPAALKRCLKLSMTDGVQRVFGMEYRPISELQVLSPAGQKIIIRNVQIRRGLLMIVPEVLEMLGGQVEDLESARRRLVEEVNKPPRGKRKQCILPLSKRASLAAWPSSTTNGSAQQSNISMPQITNNPQSLHHEFGRIPIGSRTIGAHTAQDNQGSTVEVVAAPPMGRSTAEEPTTIEEFINVPVESNIIGERNLQETEGRPIEEFVAPLVERIVVEESDSDRTKADADPNPAIYTSARVEDIHMLDVKDTLGEVAHPIILSGDKEIPFTYLACVLAKWTAQKDHTTSIQGKVKCILTGVKGFQFKQRSTYELCVYVDDGSLISEVLIHHQVVQKGIGHTPQEVTAALSSSDKETVNNMREAMKRFQFFLSKFEGTVLVEMNANSPFPVVLEMNQGCSQSDAWLLLSRLKKFTAPQKQHHRRLAPIDLSP